VSPEESPLLSRQDAMERIALLLNRPLPETRQERVAAYCDYLMLAMRNDWRGLAIDPAEVFDTIDWGAPESLTEEDLMDILDEAVYVFAPDSHAIELLKRALRYRFAWETKRDGKGFQLVWRAWERWYVDDKFIVDWLSYAADPFGAPDDWPEILRTKIRDATVVKEDDDIMSLRENLFRDFVRMWRERNVINITGEARSGKTTAAKKVAGRLKCAYLDAGNIYRAFVWKALSLAAGPARDMAARVEEEFSRRAAARSDGADIPRVPGATTRARRDNEEQARNVLKKRGVEIERMDMFSARDTLLGLFFFFDFL
jgi:hypothetical protein